MRRLTAILITLSLALLLSVTAYASVDDLTDTSDMPTAEQLESALRYDLVPYAEDYIAAAERYGVDVYFLAAKDALESGWGRYMAAPNNLGGWTNNEGDYMEFGTVEEYIDYSARNISAMYLDTNGVYHRGISLEAVNEYYNGSDFWLTEVAGIMRTLRRRCSP